MGLWTFLVKTWKLVFDSTADPRVMSWPLVNNIKLNLFILICYALFVNIIGPRWMKNKQAFDLRRIIVVYNIFLIVVNFIIFWKIAKIRWFSDVDVRCNPILLSDHPESLQMVELTWWYYLTKFIELADTVFFVLRKKENQLSKLHLIHHTSVPAFVWGLLRTHPGGYNTFFPYANAFVHVVMYSYYTLAALGDEVKEYLWFKKYVTMTQMIQFICVFTYFASSSYFGCQVDNVSWAFNMFLAIFFLVLFSNFYYHAYLEHQHIKKYGYSTKHANGVKRKRIL